MIAQLRGARATRVAACLVLACGVVVLPSCGGGGSGGESTSPSAVAAEVVPSGGGPADVINIDNESRVFVSVTLPPDSRATDVVRVSLDDGGGGVVTDVGPGLEGGGVLVVGPFDVSGLADGDVDLIVEVERSPRGRAVRDVFGPVLKDTVAPRPPDSARVIPPAGAHPSQINGTNEDRVEVELAAAGGLEDATYLVVLSDGSDAHATDPFQPPPAAAVAVSPPLDVSDLADGPLTLSVVTRDAAGNEIVFTGEPTEKDGFVAAPVAAAVPGAPPRPAGIVNGSSEASVEVRVTMPPESVAGDFVSVTITDGVATATAPPQAAPPGGGVLTFFVDASLLADGGLALAATVVDDFANRVDLASDPVSKDTAIGSVSAVLVAAGAANAAGIINQASSGAVVVDVSLDAGVELGDLVTVDLTDSAGGVVSAQAATLPGPVTMSLTVDATSLLDGAISLAAHVSDAAGNASATLLAAASKDVVPPAAPTSIAVPAGPANPAGFVNSVTRPAARVDVVTPIGLEAGVTIDLTVSDGATSIPQSAPAPAGGGTVTFPAIDMTPLLDGPLALAVRATDPFGNVSTAAGSATLDTALTAPNAAAIPAGPANAAGFVSKTSAPSVTLTLGFPGGAAGSDIVNATLTAGGTPLALPTRNAPSGAGTITYTGLDATALPDGPLGLTGTVADVAGNTVGFGPFTFVKDVVAPAAPGLARVAAGAMNAAGEINSSNVAAVQIDVSWDASMAGDEQATITLLHQGSPPVTLGPIMPPAGGGLVTVGPLDATPLADGTASLTVTLSDPAGNVTIFAGTPATKTTSGPAAPAQLRVAAGAGNPADVINLSSESAVVLDVVWDPSMTGTETFTLTLADGTGASVTFGPGSPPAGGGAALIGPVDASSLADGTITPSLVLTDPMMNATVYVGTAATKDTSAPAPPSTLRVAAGPDNAADVINAASDGAVMLQVTWAATLDGTESATFALTSGAATLMSGPLAPPAGGGPDVIGPIDATSLPDGSVGVDVVLTDTAGNTTVFSGTPATKDTVPPVAPSVAGVAAGAMNAADLINQASEGAVLVAVTFAAGADAADSVVVTLSDGAVTAVSAPFAAPAGSGTVVSPAIDATALADGAIPVALTVTDVAGNVTAFGGTPAVKDTGIATPSSAHVAAGPQNPIDFVNALTESSVQVDVQLAAGSLAGDSVRVRLTDGVTTVMTGAQPATAGAGTVSFSGVDLSVLLDGPVALAVELTDASGNAATFTGTAATKDVVAPSAPASAFVVAGPQNAQDVVNAATQGAVTVDVQLPGSYDGSELIVVSLNDGVSPLVVSPAMPAAAGGGTVTFPGLDVSSLADGTLALVVSATDPAGNRGQYNGDMATKDTVAPAPPLDLGVAAGATNAADQINQSSETAVRLDVTWDASLNGTEAAVVTLADGGGGMVTLGPLTAPAGGGAAVIGPVDASSLADGAVTITLDLTDIAGNSTSFAGTPATKSSTAADPPIAAAVDAGPGNPADFINAASVNAIAVTVTFGPTSDPANNVMLTLDDGATQVTAGPLSAPSGAGSVTFAGVDASSLAEGPVAVLIEVTDVFTNVTPFTGTPATKDTVAPAPAIAAGVPASAQNPADVVNAATETAVSVTVTGDPTWDGTETVTVTFDDGAAPPVTTPGVTANAGGAPTTETGIDLSGLADGVIMLTVTATDPAGNPVTSAGAPASKDTSPPAPPTGLGVAAGAMNAAGVVNGASEGAVMVDVVWGASNDGSETATLDFTSSGGGAVSLGPVAVPAGGGAQVLGPVDLSSLGDGVVTITVVVTDAAGNSSTAGGAPATKDATPPAPPVSARVRAGASNGQDVINIASVGAVFVDVTFGAGSLATDQVVLTLRDPLAV